MKASDFPTIVGAPSEGGFYAGQLRAVIDGEEATIVNIVAPKALEFRGAWLPEYRELPFAYPQAWYDGLQNTRVMAEAGSEIAQKVLALREGGFDDWHIPAFYQLELCYRLLKPTTDKNNAYLDGANPCSLPPGFPYTEEDPPQTSAQAFRAGGEQAFEEAYYWTSTQNGRHYAWIQSFDDGLQTSNGKDTHHLVRPVRRLILR